MRTVVALALVLCMSVPAGVCAQMVGGGSEGKEIKTYARTALISEQEAAKRIKLQDSSEVPIQHLVESYKGRLAGAYWEDVPELRFVIRVKGAGPVINRKISTKSGDVPVIIKGGAEKSLEELQAVIASHYDELFSNVPGLEGVFVDERTSQIVLHVYNKEIDREYYKKEIPLLEKKLNNPVRIDFIPGPMQPAANPSVRGGAILENVNRCTGGFIVKHAKSGKEGILTAGHCPDKLVYYNWQAFDSGKQITAPLTLEAELWDARHDLQWHSFPVIGYTALGEIYASGTSESSGLIILSSSTPNTGRRVCHRGVYTGHSCGLVSATQYSFKPGACNGENCDSSAFLVVVGNELACFSGDSGGPVHAGNSAMGIVAAASYAGPNPGQCGALAFMKISSIKDAGLTLK
ncbi:peptidase [Xanthomonas cannabis]|uniref:peptidase n=1 Tax=Xanthomonas cannabis TaxID=1885674 RepID=UPI0009DDED86|nr:peptidase [Xanthomonas cannabis]MCC8443804.1 S1 family peptidase [Xanthomonas cannabis]